MNWLRRLRMRIHGARQMRRRCRDYQPRHLKVDCLPRTTPAPARCEQCGSRERAEIGGQLLCAGCGAVPVSEWPPRITRWIRIACPLPDDTILLSPIPAATVLEFMGRGFLWDPR